MKLNWQWPPAVIFSVVFLCMTVLVIKGILPSAAMTSLIAWLIPSPLTSTSQSEGSSEGGSK